MHRLLAVSWVVLSLGLMLSWSSAAHAFSSGFVENRGQVNEAVRYYLPGSGAAVYFTPQAVVIDLKGPVAWPADGRDQPGQPFNRSQADSPPAPQASRGCAVYVRFEGANPWPTVEARAPLAARYNYFLGNDPQRWCTDVPAFQELIYHELWPGIDLIFRDVGGRVTYDVILAPGADRGLVRFSYAGAERITTREDGSLLVETSAGSFTDQRPVPGNEGGTFLCGKSRWEPGDRPTGDRDNPTALLWSTFLGGAVLDVARGIALDLFDRPVLTGQTASLDFPTTPGAYDESLGGLWDAFVAKLDASGSTLIWSTFLGGASERDWGYDLALDRSGNPLVRGGTFSSDFPTTPGAYDESYNGGVDLFVTKIDSSGSALLWSTLLGGSSSEYGFGLALDSSDNPVVTGYTYSHGFPTTPGAYDQSHDRETDAFAAKLDASGSALLWSTFLGGDMFDEGMAVTVDPSGNPIVTGQTASYGFPTTPGAYSETYNGGGWDIFVTKLNAAGSALLWSTFLGGSSHEWGLGLALDPSGTPVVTGFTKSSNFPATPGAYDETFNGAKDVFVTKLNASGSALLWSTFLGHDNDDEGHALALDPFGNPVVTGTTDSPGFPTTPCAYDSSHNGDKDVFVAKLDGSGSELLWCSFLGGNAGDRNEGMALGLDLAGNPVVTGQTESPNFPTTHGAFDESYNGDWDAFVSKLDFYAGTAVDEVGKPTLAAMLGQNYPNPFTRGTTIEYDLHIPGGHVNLGVYDIRGRLIRSLMDRDAEPGRLEVYWDGRDDAGDPVPSGVYFYRLETPRGTEQKKAVMLR